MKIFHKMSIGLGVNQYGDSLSKSNRIKSGGSFYL